MFSGGYRERQLSKNELINSTKVFFVGFFLSNEHSEALLQRCSEFKNLKLPSLTIFNKVTSASAGTHRFSKLSHRSEMLHDSQESTCGRFIFW